MSDQPAAKPTPNQPAAPVCPYCGAPGAAGDRCGACRAPLDPLSRQRTQNQMGPWFVRDQARPFLPGCSYAALVAMIRRGSVGQDTAIRGPSTRQFWRLARDTPGVAHLFGGCHNCYAQVSPAAPTCPSCGTSFEPDGDREHLGLAPIRPLPGDPAPSPAPPTAPSPAHQPQDPERAGEVPVRAPPEKLGASKRLPILLIALLMGGGGVWAAVRFASNGPSAAVVAENRVNNFEANGSERQPPPAMPDESSPPLEGLRDADGPRAPISGAMEPNTPASEMTPGESVARPEIGSAPQGLEYAGVTDDSSEQASTESANAEFVRLMTDTDIQKLWGRLRRSDDLSPEARRIASKRLEQLGLGTLTRE